MRLIWLSDWQVPAGADALPLAIALPRSTAEVAAILRICHAHRIPISEEPLPLTALAQSPEAFLTSSTREVHAISHVDGNPLSQPVGPLTRRLADLFRELVSNDSDPKPASS